MIELYMYEVLQKKINVQAFRGAEMLLLYQHQFVQISFLYRFV